MHNEKPITRIGQVNNEFKKITSWATGDTRFMAKMMVLLAKQNHEIIKLLKKKESEGSVFIRFKMMFEDQKFIDALNQWKEFNKLQKQEKES